MRSVQREHSESESQRMKLSFRQSRYLVMCFVNSTILVIICLSIHLVPLNRLYVGDERGTLRSACFLLEGKVDV